LPGTTATEELRVAEQAASDAAARTSAQTLRTFSRFAMFSISPNPITPP